MLICQRATEALTSPALFGKLPTGANHTIARRYRVRPPNVVFLCPTSSRILTITVDEKGLSEILSSGCRRNKIPARGIGLLSGDSD